MKKRLKSLPKKFKALRRLRAMRKHNIFVGGIRPVKLKELAPEEKLLLAMLAFGFVFVLAIAGVGLKFFFTDPNAKVVAAHHAEEEAAEEPEEKAEGGHEGGEKKKAKLRPPSLSLIRKSSPTKSLSGKPACKTATTICVTPT